MKLRQARLCKKNNFSGSNKIIFSHASCQICQLHLVTSFKLAPNYADACNTKLRMPQEFEGPSACCSVNLPAFKNKNLRDPGPQAFGFLTRARAVANVDRLYQ